MQWDLKKLLDGKTYACTYDDGLSYTVTLSDLNLNAMTVTATYSYTPGESEYNNRNYYVTNLKGQEVNKLTGTVECHIEELERYGAMNGYHIWEAIGSLWLNSNWYYVDRVKDVGVWFIFDNPLADNGGVGVLSNGDWSVSW